MCSLIFYVFKACVHYFYQISVFHKMLALEKLLKKNFMEKALVVRKIFKVFPFFPTLYRFKRTNGCEIIYNAMNWFA